MSDAAKNIRARIVECAGEHPIRGAASPSTSAFVNYMHAVAADIDALSARLDAQAKRIDELERRMEQGNPATSLAGPVGVGTGNRRASSAEGTDSPVSPVPPAAPAREALVERCPYKSHAELATKVENQAVTIRNLEARRATEKRESAAFAEQVRRGGRFIADALHPGYGPCDGFLADGGCSACSDAINGLRAEARAALAVAEEELLAEPSDEEMLDLYAEYNARIRSGVVAEPWRAALCFFLSSRRANAG